MQAELIGRDAEVAALEAWLAEPWGRLVLLEGQAGIGKTTIWRHACSLATGRGYTVVTSSPAEAERQLVFAGLTDLLGPLLPAAAETMAPPRRRAIEAALLLDDGKADSPDERAVAFAALDVLRLVGHEQPLVLAIDDLQWLDRSSLAVLAFALRRLVPADRVAVVAARRTGTDDRSSSPFVEAVDDALRTVVTIGPLSLGALHRLYRERLGLSLPRPRIVRIQEACGGNPLFALEVGRALAADPGSDRSELPIPASLSEALGARLAALSERARRVALLAAAAAEPTTSLLAAASDVGDPRETISELEQAGVFVAHGDSIRFAHPLLASVAYARSSARERRDAHAALVAVVTAPEERARHLALATPGPDASAAAALDEAADLAEARGAQAASGDLRAWAAETTPTTDVSARARRLVAAGTAMYMSGDVERARALLEPVASASGPSQHEALWWLGTLHSEATSWDVAREHWLAALATDDLELRVNAERSLALGAVLGLSVETALAHSTSALEAAERLGDGRLISHALATDGFVRTLGGDPHAPEIVAAAVGLARDDDLSEESPSIVAADCARHALDLKVARDMYAWLHELGVARGDFRTEQWALCGSAQVAIDLGDLPLAQELREAVDELTEQSGLKRVHALRLGARLEANRGNAEACRALTAQCLAEGGATGERLQGLLALAALGRLELSEGNLEAAVDALEAAHTIATELGIGLPGVLVFMVDEVEALAGVGRVEEAAAVLLAFEHRVDPLDCTWARPLLDRARGLVAAARGDLDGGVQRLRAAEARREDLSLPLERGRIDLCLGRVLRRSKRRAEAREALDRAVEAFDALGTVLWAEQARTERARIGGRAAPSGLTPTEAQVAALVAAGGSNKEVAAALFVTVNTVEAHLSRVYKKLGVRSRSQLARSLAEQGPGVSGLSAPEEPA